MGRFRSFIDSPITLSDAILIVLQDAVDRTATTADIAKAINTRRLYIQRDGGEVFPEQIYLRVRKDAAFFEVIDRNTIKSRFAGRRRSQPPAERNR